MEFINLHKPLEAGKEVQGKRKRKVIIVNEIKISSNLGRLLDTVDQKNGQTVVKWKMERGKRRTKRGGGRTGGNLKRRRRKRNKAEEEEKKKRKEEVREEEVWR